MVNELLVLVAAYPLLMFTSQDWSQEFRINIAWMLLTCIAVLILFNIIVYCYAIINWIKLKCRICLAKKRAERLMKAARGTAAATESRLNSES